MVDIPEELKQYGFETAKKHGGIEKTVYNNLTIMHDQAEKLVNCYDRYCRCDDERLRDDLVEAMNSRVNHLSQAFRDIMAFIEINEKDRVYEESIRYYVRQYLSKEISKTEAEKQAVEFLTKRNDLVHDYFNINQLNDELIKGMDNFGEGFLEMAVNLKDYCVEHFPSLKLEKNLTKTIREKTRPRTR
jgi:hypothetical protein